MASGVRAENLGEDWSDNEEKIHEIVLQDTEITEQEENIRAEPAARRTGPVWVTTEVSEAPQSEPAVKGKYKAPKKSDKIAPTNDAQNFPSIGDIASEKSSQRSDLKTDEKPEKTQSNNRFEDLKIVEVEVKTEENPIQKPAKKGKKKKNDWKKVETHVKIATTVEDINSDDIFKKEAPKLPERIGYQSESRSFNIKPSGAGFRNFENKLETGIKNPETGFRTTENKLEAGFRNFENKAESGFKIFENKQSGFRAAGEGNVGFVRRTENFPEIVEEKATGNVWRKTEDTNKEQNTAENGERPVKKFFNANKGTKDSSFNPLESKPKEQQGVKKDVWGDSAKDDGKKKNPWGRVN